MNKEIYQAPTIEVMEMEHEGVLAVSGVTGIENPPGMPYVELSRTRPNEGFNGGIANDLEEMINHIFTVEQ